MSFSGIYVNSSGSGPGATVMTLTSNVGGPITPTGGNINVNGGNNITGTGVLGTSTITFNLTGTTNHALQVGNASGSLTSLAVAGNGQIPIGSVGANPVLATLTAGPGITVTNGAGSITISSSGTSNLNYTNVAVSPYVVLPTDEYLSVDCSAVPITIELPNAPATGTVYIIKDRMGNAQVNNISVTTVGGVETVDLVTPYVMNTRLASIEVIFNGANWEIF